MLNNRGNIFFCVLSVRSIREGLGLTLYIGYPMRMCAIVYSYAVRILRSRLEQDTGEAVTAVLPTMLLSLSTVHVVV